MKARTLADLRRSLFGDPLNAGLSLLILAAAIAWLPPLLRWAVLDARAAVGAASAAAASAAMASSAAGSSASRRRVAARRSPMLCAPPLSVMGLSVMDCQRVSPCGCCIRPPPCVPVRCQLGTRLK